MDNSALDKKYFIDEHVFNCPFCKRNNVSYSIVATFSYNFSSTKIAYIFLAECDSCKNVSMHSSFTLIYKYIDGNV